uniref:Uncharacterized protein n=1 Tax=Strigamia maritima TaxID=126957 RepID=T1J5X2_STRMM
MIYVKSVPKSCSPHKSEITLSFDKCTTAELLKWKLKFLLNINPDSYKLYRGKKALKSTDLIEDNDVVHMHFSLPGGKGGFGSMLRAIGAQIEKTTNKEACRDLSGRRLRDINEERRLKKWIAKQTEREREREERRKQRLQRLVEKPKHQFHDPEYDKALSNLASNINDALTEGLKRSEKVENEPTTSKRKGENEPSTSSKKLKGWQMDDDFDNLSSDTDSSQSDDDSSVNQVVSSENSNDTQEETQKTEVITNENQQASSDLVTTTDSDSCSKSNFDDEVKPQTKITDIDLNDYNSIEELEAVGLESLKVALKTKGMKFGGTARQRAERLFNCKENAEQT